MDPRGLAWGHGALERRVPPGAPNFAPRLMAATWLLTVFSAIFLGLRLYCKLSRGRRLWWDDHFLTASWVSILVSTAMLSEGIKYGIGLHYYNMDLDKMPTMAMISYAAGFATILGTIWSKTSFGITLLRISAGRMRWLVWFIIISVNLVLGVSATIHWAQCWPLKKLFYYDMAGTCLPLHVVQNYQTFAAVYSGLLDTILAFLPWKIIWTVTINKKERLGALIAMSMGVFSGIMSFLKLSALGDISDNASTTVDLKIYGTAEPAVTIMAISIPVLRAFLRPDSPAAPTEFIQFSDFMPDFSPLDSFDEKKEKDSSGSTSSGPQTPR